MTPENTEPAMETTMQLTARLTNEVSSGDQKTFEKNEVCGVISQIRKAAAREIASGARGPTEVKDIRRGDVFIAKLVGGKVRPWIVLKVFERTVFAVAMSSGESVPGLQQSRCRLWPGRWFGSTLSTFSKEAAMKEVTRPYTNMRHLREVEAALLFSARPQPEIKSIKQIRERLGT